MFCRRRCSAQRAIDIKQYLLAFIAFTWLNVSVLAQTLPTTIEDRAAWLNHVPESTLMALVAYPEEVFSQPSMELVPRELITLLGKRELGLDFCQLTRVVVAIEKFDDLTGPPPGLGVVLNFSSPQSLSDNILSDFQPRTWQGYEAYESTGTETMRIVVVDEKTIAIGNNFLQGVLAEKQKPGAVANLVKKQAFVGEVGLFVDFAGIRPLVVENLPPADQVPLPLRQFLALPDLIESISAEITAVPGGKNQLHFHTTSTRDSERVWDLLQTGLAMAREAILMQVLSEMDPNDLEMQTAIQSYVARVGAWIQTHLKPEINERRLTFNLDVSGQMQMVSIAGMMAGMLLPAVQQVREAARRTSSANNLKQIGMALHNYDSAYNRFPDRAIRSADGTPLLSWRVAILPFLEQDNLYKQFRLDEPWDSDHNLALLEMMPPLYANPNVPGQSDTVYLAPVGPNCFYEGLSGRRITDIVDGTSNTIMLVEANAERAVPWTKPDDFECDLEAPMNGLGNLRPNGFNALLADGAVRFITRGIDPQVLRNLFQVSDGNPVDID